VAGADTEATAENGPLADSSSEAVVNNSLLLHFDGKLRAMQGIICTPSGDVWALDNDDNQIIYFPKGDLSKGRRTVSPLKALARSRGPFHLAIDQQVGFGSLTAARTCDAIPGQRSDQGRTY
jgi:hypothetical protein